MALLAIGFACGFGAAVLLYGFWLPAYTRWIMTHEHLPERRRGSDARRR